MVLVLAVLVRLVLACLVGAEGVEKPFREELSKPRPLGQTLGLPLYRRSV